MHLHEREIKDLEAIREILLQGKYAVIAMCSGQSPYLVTLNYGYDRERHALYFHSATKGLKLEILAQNPRVCATVIQDRGYVAGECAHAYRSAVLYGPMQLVDDADEKKHGMLTMLYQLEAEPQAMATRLLAKEKFLRGTAMLRLDIEQITAKEGQ
jgi:uncharacterized protein